jgi:hypothetical protein
MSIQQMLFSGAPALTRVANATGGTITYDGVYQIHTFTSTGNFRVTQRSVANLPVNVLVANGGNVGAGGGEQEDEFDGTSGGPGGYGGSYNSATSGLVLDYWSLNTDYAATVGGAQSMSTFILSSSPFTIAANVTGGAGGAEGSGSGSQSTSGGNGSNGTAGPNLFSTWGRLICGGGGGGGGGGFRSANAGTQPGNGGAGNYGGGNGGQGGQNSQTQIFAASNAADGEVNSGGGGGGGGGAAGSSLFTGGGLGGLGGSGIVIVKFVAFQAA